MANVPFYANTPDDTHCFQASLRSVLKYFESDKDFSWEQLDKITNKPTDKWTWTMAGLAWLAQNGYSVVNIETFDYPRFIAEGVSYTEEIWGKEVVAVQEAHSNTAMAQADAKHFLKHVESQYRAPSIHDIQSYVSKGFLVICMLNAGKLNGKDVYAGHSVLITDYDEDSFILHDPGLPAQENRKADYALFESAWSDPNDSAKNLVAIKLG